MVQYSPRIGSRWREIRACNDNACGESKSHNSHESLLDYTFLIAATESKAPIYCYLISRQRLATKHAGRACWGFLPIPPSMQCTTQHREKGRKWLSLRKPDRSKRHD